MRMIWDMFHTWLLGYFLVFVLVALVITIAVYIYFTWRDWKYGEKPWLKKN